MKAAALPNVPAGRLVTEAGANPAVLPAAEADHYPALIFIVAMTPDMDAKIIMPFVKNTHIILIVAKPFRCMSLSVVLQIFKFVFRKVRGYLPDFIVRNRSKFYQEREIIFMRNMLNDNRRKRI